MTLPVGLRIGSYVIAEYLGEGGTSEVYLVRRDEESFALKILKEEERQSEVLQTRLINEAASLRQLNVEGVVRVHDEGDFAGRPYYVMEYLPSSLVDRLQRPLWPSQIVPNIRTILRILSVLHESRFVHRDVKPSNILFAPDGSVRLADFGHAKLPMEQLAVVPHSTQTGAFLGTREYAAPEQFLNAKTVDGRADVYAVGLILFEALAGRRPFPTENPEELARLRLTVRAPRLSSPLVELSPQLVTLVAKMLERSPQSRPTAKEVESSLASLPQTRYAAATWRRYAVLLMLPALLSLPLCRPPISEMDRILDEQSLSDANVFLWETAQSAMSPLEQAQLLQKRADIQREQGQLAEAARLYSDASTQFHALSERKGEADSINRLADMRLHQGDTASAQRLYSQSVALRGERAARKEDLSPDEFYFAPYRLGLLAIEQADWALARDKLKEALRLPLKPLWRARTEERLASLPAQEDAVQLSESALVHATQALREQPSSKLAHAVFLRVQLRHRMLRPNVSGARDLYEELHAMWSQDKQRGIVAHEYLELLMEGIEREPNQAERSIKAREVLRELQQRGQWQDDVHIQRWKVRLGA